jgi:hypothetical protein
LAQEISLHELMEIIGDKECQILFGKTREAAMLKTIELQKQKIAQLEAAAEAKVEK